MLSLSLLPLPVLILMPICHDSLRCAVYFAARIQEIRYTAVFFFVFALSSLFSPLYSFLLSSGTNCV